MNDDTATRIRYQDAPFHLGAQGVDWVEQTLAAMTLEQRIGQLLCIYLKSDDMGAWTSWLDRTGIEPGGMLMTMRSRDAARADTAALQEWSPVPLLIAANLESGTVNFLTGTEAFANPMQIAATRSTESAERLAVHCARAGDDIGVNWAFAPVIDLALNPHNPITNTRTFGSDRDLVASLSETYIRTLEARGIATSPKHFPGDGHDDRDQHLVTTSNDLSLEQWWDSYGQVWQRAIAAGARTVMVGHIRQPALTRSLLPSIAPREIMPGSLAPELIQGVLRDQLGFQGLVVTDNSAMTGFTSLMPRADALPLAITAGNDMLLGNVDVETDFAILLAAARSGALPVDRLDEAVRRVLAVKASIGLHVDIARADRERPDQKQERRWRSEVAAQSVTVVKNRDDLLPITARPGLRTLVYVLGDEATFYDPTPPLSEVFIGGLRRRGLEVEVRRLPDATATIPDAELLHERFDLCVYYADLRFVGNSNVLRLAWAPPQGPDAPRHVATLPTVLVSVADPYLLQDAPMIPAAINGYTPTTDTVESALAILFGERAAQGTSPVDPFAGHWDAAL